MSERLELTYDKLALMYTMICLHCSMTKRGVFEKCHVEPELPHCFVIENKAEIEKIIANEKKARVSDG